MLSDPQSIVVDALGRLHRALLDQDVEAALDCFVPDGALFGSSLSEDAHGHGELARTFAIIIDRGLSPEWEIDESYTRQDQDVLSFVADATLIVGVLGRRARRRRFRLSGSLRTSDGSYRLELFNGFDPILGDGLHLVG